MNSANITLTNRTVNTRPVCVAAIRDRLGFSTVVVNSGTPDQQLIAWPTGDTQDFIDAMNHVLRERRSDINLADFDLTYPLTLEDAIKVEGLSRLYNEAFSNNDQRAVGDLIKRSDRP